MQIRGSQINCQISHLREMVEGPQGFRRRSLKQVIRTYLGPHRMRAIEIFVNDFKNRVAKWRGANTKPARTIPQAQLAPFMAGDWVRVKSKEEIEETLDHFRRLRGCSFPSEMVQYCGTKRRVLKPVERFVDERDLRVRRTKGVFLLEDVTCGGVGGFGRCDRNCYFFWREEWLERIEENPG
jgi:hypothetical protein